MPSDSSAGRSPSTSDREIIEVIVESSNSVITTKEVAEALPIGERQTRNRLLELHKDGELSGRKINEHGTWVWWSESKGTQKIIKRSKATGFNFVNEFSITGNRPQREKRKEAIYRTFQYLFNQYDGNPIPVEYLQIVAWAIDNETYANKKSLWKNCVQGKLSSTIFFTYSREPDSAGGWKLSTDGRKIKSYDLVENFDSIRKYKRPREKLKRHLHETAKYEISSEPTYNPYSFLIEVIDFEYTDQEYNRSKLSVEVNHTGCSLDIYVDLGNPFWICGNGSISCKFVSTANFERFRPLVNKIDEQIDQFDMEGSVNLNRYDNRCELLFEREAQLYSNGNIDPSVEWLRKVHSRIQETLDQFG